MSQIVRAIGGVRGANVVRVGGGVNFRRMPLASLSCAYNVGRTEVALFWRYPNNVLVTGKLLDIIAWTPATAKATYDYVQPTTPNGLCYEAKRWGLGPYVTGATEPTWPTSPGSLSGLDGKIKWSCRLAPYRRCTGVLVMRRHGTFPESPRDPSAEEVYSGTAYEFTDTDVAAGDWLYRVWAKYGNSYSDPLPLTYTLTVDAPATMGPDY